MWLVDGLVGVMKRSGEASRFVTLMELTGITEQLQQMHEFTVFLPSDDAIQVCMPRGNVGIQFTQRSIWGFFTFTTRATHCNSENKNINVIEDLSVD